MKSVIADRLQMTYLVPIRPEGIRAALASLARRQYREVAAVRELSFTLAPGEVVGFLGPNGAGKTTTLKMLSGLLHPSSGRAEVLGFTPARREPAFLRQIGLIRGSRPLSVPGELTLLDALRFQQLLYEVDEEAFRQSLAELTEMLGLEPLLQRQVRALSLGERMRAGLAYSLLYRPKVLFLDEPTLGLDVTAAGLLRRFIADYSRLSGATVLLTSHYMADVESLCRRVILIDQGTLAYDGELAGLSARFAPYRLLKVAAAPGSCPRWERYGTVVEAERERVTLRVPAAEAPALTARLLAELPVADLTLAEPPLESIMDLIFRKGA